MLPLMERTPPAWLLLWPDILLTHTLHIREPFTYFIGTFLCDTIAYSLLTYAVLRWYTQYANLNAHVKK